MSHEIRTPMNGVMSMAEMLEQTDLSADQREMSKVIRASAESLMTILNDILDFSKIEAGRIEFERLPIDVGDVVEEAAELIAARADEKGLDLVVDLDPALPSQIAGDPTRIRQIVLPAMVPGGPLALLAEFRENNVSFTGKPITLETDTPIEKAQAAPRSHFQRGSSGTKGEEVAEASGSRMRSSPLESAK
jgi:nitrogen-specific signal transduction histidine kinase